MYKTQHVWGFSRDIELELVNTIAWSELLDAAVQVMSNIGRLDDFVSLLEAIGKGLVSNNVALHLCLDIGALRRVKALSTMSYPKISMDWWLTVKIVIKGMLGASSFSIVPSNTITKMI